MKTITTLLLFLSILSCNGQKDKKIVNEKKNNKKVTTINNNNMEKFDVENFKKNQKENEWIFIDNEGNNHYQRDVKDEYWEEINSKNIDFTIHKRFYRNGKLKEIGESFLNGGAQKGVWKEYNEHGMFIKDFDFDIPYKNSPWEKVKEYLMSRKVDLKDNYTSVWREENNEGTFWMISWDAHKLSEMGTKTINNIVIDVKTGKITKEYITMYKD